MDIFASCHEINDLINEGEARPARDALIKLLSYLEEEQITYPPYLNELIRSTGLFPYMKYDSATWDQKYVQSAFAVDVGRKKVTLHREQSLVLKKLIEGTNLAVSAPTSFGKSFIIDAYIAAKKPRNVVIIVPTIALMDETRRRIFKKFSDKYNIVTAPDSALSEKNILIFPQERTFRYIRKLDSIDLLVVDEFYKISPQHDKERSPALMKAVLKLSAKSKQRYYLTPNIKKLGKNVFTEGMEFLELLDFNTVF
ncbi:DEAD/DEAH box helicase [Methylobacterium sp. P31]